MSNLYKGQLVIAEQLKTDKTSFPTLMYEGVNET